MVDVERLDSCPAVVDAVSVPTAVTDENVTEAGAYVWPVPTSKVRLMLEPIETGFWRLPSTKPVPSDTAPLATRVLEPVTIRPDVSVRVPPTVTLLLRVTVLAG